MALFSRRKNTPQQPDAAEPTLDVPDVVDVADAAEVAAEPVPEVGISLSTFGGLGAPAQPADPEPAPAQQSSPFNEDGSVRLPFAPPVPPEAQQTVEGLLDHAVLRDALARLSDDPSGAEVLGVARQALGAHLFLRVQGDARALVEAGQPLPLGVVNDGERQFLMAFSSGAALQKAVEADNDVETSAVGQPARAVLQHALDNEFDGIVLDNWSAPARVVLPRDLLERMLGESDPEFRLKTVLVSARSDATEPAVVEALKSASLWVAVGKAGEIDGEVQYGVAEARTPEGDRLLQLFSHPLEVVALGRDERPAPFSTEQLRTALSNTEGIAGVLIDAAGPMIRVDREALLAILED